MTSEPSTRSGPPTARRTREDICAALAGMSVLERRQLVLVAKSFARRYQLTADDLLQEAYLRVLSTRTCAADVSIVEYLAGVIRSVAWDGLSSRTNGFITYVTDYTEAHLAGAAAQAVTPEDEALSKIKHAQHLARSLKCIEDDETLQLLVEGLFDGLRGRDLEDLLGTDTKGLAAAKRRLTRKLESEYPAGIPL